MKGILYAVAVALLFISLASAQDYVYILASNSNPVQLSPDQSNTTYIFKKNFTFIDIVIDNKTIAFNTTTNYPTTLMIEGNGTLNITINALQVNRYYAFTMQSNINPSPVVFSIQSHIPEREYKVYLDGKEYDTGYTNKTGWILYTYNGSFSKHTIAFSMLPSPPPPSPTPTQPPTIPPVQPPSTEASFIETLWQYLTNVYVVIVLLTILLVLILIRR